MASLSDTRFSRKISCQQYINAWLSIMSGHGANPIFNFTYISIYKYAIMKTMCPPGYHHNGFVATHALGHMMYSYTLLVPMNQH